jgi:hypothetical protein
LACFVPVPTRRWGWARPAAPYLAAMATRYPNSAMNGAAGESILLAVAIAKIGDEAKVLKDYSSGGGRSRLTKQIVAGLSASIARTLEAALQVLHYWRDDAAHGVATTISEVEAYASLTQLLRLELPLKEPGSQAIARRPFRH